MIGSRVRRLREALGLSLADLGARAGMSRTTVHDIEQGGANPRLDTLYTLATALGVGLADLLATPDEASAGWVVRAGEGPVVHGETVRARLIGRIEVDGHIEVYALAVAEGLQHSTGHAGSVRECMVVHTGAITTGPTEVPVELRAGDAALFAAGQDHTYGSTIPDGGQAVLIVIHDDP